MKIGLKPARRALAAIIGMSAFGSRLSVWADKTSADVEEQGETSTGYIWDMASGGKVRLLLELIE